ncbi:hypothetical protein [Actinocorallia sp. A-T 12471]|uniref:hypothetical protein n=1 Tax=Actinocorallia sp. A-T 12471 TaxID=3089813 RepID=UPI0029D054B2|nr:hypothetical protein [Actinocorallia sp. A-T 12471]MDX6744919.1 hypothetical protein [Actinocorallia sp. A-T 12471]
MDLYRSLLRAYPPAYRDAHGPEILATLADRTDGFSVREGAALVRAGLRARLSAASPGNPWADGLHLGLTLFTLGNLIAHPHYLSEAFAQPLAALAAVGFAVALLRGWTATAAVVFLGLIYALPTDVPLFRFLGDERGVPHVVCAALLVLAGWRAFGVRVTPKPWGLLWIPGATLVLVVVVDAAFFLPAYSSAVPGVLPEAVVLVGVLGAALLARDPRWSLAVLVVVLLDLVPFLAYLDGSGPLGRAYAVGCAVLGVVAAGCTVAYRKGDVAL